MRYLLCALKNRLGHSLVDMANEPRLDSQKLELDSIIESSWVRVRIMLARPELASLANSAHVVKLDPGLIKFSSFSIVQRLASELVEEFSYLTIINGNEEKS